MLNSGSETQEVKQKGQPLQSRNSASAIFLNAATLKFSLLERSEKSLLLAHKLVLLSAAKRAAHYRAATLPKKTSCCCTYSATPRKSPVFCDHEAKLGL